MMPSNQSNETFMSSAEKDAIERRDEVISLLEEHAGTAINGQGKEWLLDQIARTLLGNEYEQWVEEYEKAGKAVPVRKWLTGVEPKPERQLSYEDFPIQRGDIWVNRSTGKEVLVLNTPRTRHADVDLQHESGRTTSKKQHYFLYDYEKKGE